MDKLRNIFLGLTSTEWLISNNDPLLDFLFAGDHDYLFAMQNLDFYVNGEMFAILTCDNLNPEMSFFLDFYLKEGFLNVCHKFYFF